MHLARQYKSAFLLEFLQEILTLDRTVICVERIKSFFTNVVSQVIIKYSVL